MITPVLLYEVDYWAIKSTQVQKMKAIRIRMLRWIHKHNRREMIRKKLFGARSGRCGG